MSLIGLDKKKRNIEKFSHANGFNIVDFYLGGLPEMVSVKDGLELVSVHSDNENLLVDSRMSPYNEITNQQITYLIQRCFVIILSI